KMVANKNRRFLLWLGLVLLVLTIALPAGKVLAGKLTDTSFGLSVNSATSAKDSGQPSVVNSNLLPNPGFETGSLTPEWTTFNPGGGTATGVIESTIKRTGSYSAKVQFNSNTTPGGGIAGGGSCGGGSGNRVPVVGSASYTFSGW